jgi:hypothetical protein
MQVTTLSPLPRTSERLRDTALEDATDLRSTICLRREHSSDCQQRQIFVRLDGGERIALVYGDTVTIEVRPGSHHLFAHNTLFWKTVPFAIEPAEHLEFELINSDRWWTAGIVGVFGAAPLFLTVRLVHSAST